jgi:hypothetical protein
MEITAAMMRAAREAEFGHYQQAVAVMTVPLPDALMKAIIDAAISAIGVEDHPEPEPMTYEQDDEVQPVAPPKKVRDRHRPETEAKALTRPLKCGPPCKASVSSAGQPRLRGNA